MGVRYKPNQSTLKQIADLENYTMAIYQCNSKFKNNSAILHIIIIKMHIYLNVLSIPLPQMDHD